MARISTPEERLSSLIDIAVGHFRLAGVDSGRIRAMANDMLEAFYGPPKGKPPPSLLDHPLVRAGGADKHLTDLVFPWRRRGRLQ